MIEHYVSLEERQAIIEQKLAEGFILVEDQIHFDGNWLLFTDEPYSEPLPARDLGEEIDDLKVRIEKLEMR